MKFQINPHHESGRDTICQTIRLMWRRFDVVGDEEGKALAAEAYDYAKRIVSKAQEHKAARGITGPLIRDGHPEADD